MTLLLTEKLDSSQLLAEVGFSPSAPNIKNLRIHLCNYSRHICSSYRPGWQAEITCVHWLKAAKLDPNLNLILFFFFFSPEDLKSKHLNYDCLSNPYVFILYSLITSNVSISFSNVTYTVQEHTEEGYWLNDVSCLVYHLQKRSMARKSENTRWANAGTFPPACKNFQPEVLWLFSSP